MPCPVAGLTWPPVPREGGHGTSKLDILPLHHPHRILVSRFRLWLQRSAACGAKSARSQNLRFCADQGQALWRAEQRRWLPCDRRRMK